MEKYAVSINEHFVSNMTQGERLYVTEVSGQELWKIYLNHFGKGGVFRIEETHNCKHCSNFIERYGNVVSIGKDGEIISLFSFEFDDEEYGEVNAKLRKAVERSRIVGVFTPTYDVLNIHPYEKTNKNQEIYRLGFKSNEKVYTLAEANASVGCTIDTNRTYKFNHFYLDIPRRFVDFSGQSEASIQSDFRARRESFEKGLNILKKETLQDVIEYIGGGAVLDAEDQIDKLNSFIGKLEEYGKLNSKQKYNWLWLSSGSYPYFRLVNELIGTLCVEIQDPEIGTVKAINAWNVRIDPTNHGRAKSPITAAQKKEADKVVKEKGYLKSFERRLASIDDIRVTEIKHVNNPSGKVAAAGLFDEVPVVNTSSKSRKTVVESTSGVNPIDIEKFMNEVVPGASEIEVMFDSKHAGNLVTLTTAVNEDAKPIFPWDNNYAWDYKGGLSGKSRIAENVKKVGGNTDNPVRVSLQWNEDGQDIVDFDLHVAEPDGARISYQNYCGKRTNSQSHTTTKNGGNLDIDMIRPMSIGIENITWNDISKMTKGNYSIKVVNFDSGRNKGFQVEVYINGVSHVVKLTGNQMTPVDIGNLVKHSNGTLTFETTHSTEVSKSEEWGINTGEFHKVKLISLSPNYWGDNAVGKKHYFFFIDGCKADASVVGFHPDQLNGELKPIRKVLEGLSHVKRINPSEDAEQLAGLGFNATVRDEVVVKVDKKLYTVKF